MRVGKDGRTYFTAGGGRIYPYTQANRDREDGIDAQALAEMRAEDAAKVPTPAFAQAVDRYTAKAADAEGSTPGAPGVHLAWLRTLEGNTWARRRKFSDKKAAAELRRGTRNPI